MENSKSHLKNLAMAAQKKAYAPYSNFFVGCALETENGDFFQGANIENSSIGATICAERVAISQAILSQKCKIKSIYIYTRSGSAPCGICRQFMSEFASKDMEIFIGGENGEEKKYTLNELFPLSFERKDLETF